MTARHSVANPTKKHLARAERDRLMRQRILAGTGVVLLAILGLLGYGWYDTTVVQPRQPVAEVNGEVITAAAFRNRVLFAQWNLLQQYQSLQQFLSFLGGDPQSLQTYQQQLLSLQGQLADPEVLGNAMLDEMVSEILMRQEAQARGIQVSEEDIDQSFERAFGFYPEGTPTPQPSPTEPTLEPTALLDPTAAAVATGQAEVTATAQAEATSVQPVIGVEETVEPEATPQPSATAYTRELYESNYQTYIATLKSFGVQEATVRRVRESQLYRDRLSETFADQVGSDQEQVWARHILVSDQELAAELLERLAAGESWEELAAQYSEDESNKDQGGDLGWFGRGVMVEPFEQAAFAGQVGEVVGPVQSDFGWHLIEILGREVRPLDSAAQERERSRLFSEWLVQSREQADVLIHDNWPERLPPPPVLPS